MLHSTKDLSILCPRIENLQENEIKGSVLIKLMEELSRQVNIMDVTWVLLAAFSDILVRMRGK